MGVLIAMIAAFVMPLPLPGGFAPAFGIAALVAVIVYQHRGTLRAGAAPV